MNSNTIGFHPKLKNLDWHDLWVKIRSLHNRFLDLSFHSGLDLFFLVFIRRWSKQTRWRPAGRCWNVAINRKVTDVQNSKLWWLLFSMLFYSLFCHPNRSTWQRVSAVRLFIEHTCPGSSACHRADDVNAFKLWKVRINLFYPSPSFGTRLGENIRHRGTVVFRRCILAGDFKLN